MQANESRCATTAVDTSQPRAVHATPDAPPSSGYLCRGSGGFLQPPAHHLHCIVLSPYWINSFKKNKRLGAYSRADRHEPGAKSRRNLEIEIPA